MTPMIMAPIIGFAHAGRARVQAELGVMAVVLAADQHRRKMGAWPASQGDIDPEILANPARRRRDRLSKNQDPGPLRE